MDENEHHWTEDQLSLVPHPAFPAPEGIALTAAASREGGTLRVVFTLFGDANDTIVRRAPPGNGGRTDGLWQHTCFETFVRLGGSPAYAELNFSPRGEWAAYRFDDYRSGMRDLTGPSEPLVHLAHRGDPGDGSYSWLFETAELFDAAADWDLSLTAVIEAKDGNKSYWALVHPSDRPDFHHPDGFVERLPAA
jgi:hypothetical protein